jgi:hypothetical protein
VLGYLASNRPGGARKIAPKHSVPATSRYVQSALPSGTGEPDPEGNPGPEAGVTAKVPFWNLETVRRARLRALPLPRKSSQGAMIRSGG